MRVGLDTSPLVQTQAGTARYVRGLLAHNEYERLSSGGGESSPRWSAMPGGTRMRSARARPAASTCFTVRPSVALYGATSRWY